MHPATLHDVRVITKLYFAICAAFKAQYRVSSRRRCVHEFATSWRQFRRVLGVNTPVGSRDPYGCVRVRIAESVGSRREFMYTPPTRRDETRQFRLVGVGGVYWA